MLKNILLYLSLVLAVLIAYLHISALENYYYWIYSWFDLVVHFLGGVLIASFSTWFYLSLSHIKEFNYSDKQLIILTVVNVLVISFLWEIFELVLWVSLNEPNYLLDTTLDTLFALSGSIFLQVLFLGSRKFLIK